jgi:hypothetical protein
MSFAGCARILGRLRTFATLSDRSADATIDRDRVIGIAPGQKSGLAEQVNQSVVTPG